MNLRVHFWPFASLARTDLSLKSSTLSVFERHFSLKVHTIPMHNKINISNFTFEVNLIITSNLRNKVNLFYYLKKINQCSWQMGLRNVIGSTMKITWTHTLRYPSAQFVTYERRLEKLWHFSLPLGNERIVVRSRFLNRPTEYRCALYYFFLPSFATRVLQFRWEFTLICPHNVQRPFCMIDRLRDERESTVLAITVIILAFTSVLCTAVVFLRHVLMRHNRIESFLGEGRDGAEGLI